MQRSKLFYLCFLLGTLPQRMLMEKPCQHRPLFQKTKKEVLKKGNKGIVQLSHHQQIRKTEPSPKHSSTQWFLSNTGLLVGQILILLTPLYM